MGVTRQMGGVSYFIGKERSRWHTDVPTYTGVLYRQAWPGVDVRFSGQQRRIEYAFTLSPGADPRRIAIGVGGARSLRVARNGDLLARLAGGVHVRELAPRAYQTDAARGQASVKSHYVISRRVVRIELGAYDHHRRLVIDPTLAYSTYLGGSSDETPFHIAVDPSGAAYITGHAHPSFPTTVGAYQTTYGGGAYDAFVSKLNPAGTALMYSTFLGGSLSDEARGIAVDSSGSAYITGQTEGAFPTTGGAYQQAYGGGGHDVFVTKLSPAGNALTYSTYVGGSGADGGYGIAVDGAGSAYITGVTNGSFPTTSGAYQSSFGGGLYNGDAFVAKLNPSGNALAYSTYLGGSGSDGGFGIGVDGSGSAYVTGDTTGSFPTTLGAFQTTFGGSDSDAFVTKLNPLGTSLSYSTYLGGSDSDHGYRIAVDASGSAYVTGGAGSGFPTTLGAYQPTFGSGIGEAFVTKLKADGSGLLYSTYLGPGSFGYGIALAADGSAYVAGSAGSIFPTTPGAYQTTYGGGGRDGFVTKLNPAGSTLSYSSYLGGTGFDQAYGVAADSAGNVYLTGGTDGLFPTTLGAYQTTYGGGPHDGFMAKFAGFGASPPGRRTLRVRRSGSGVGRVSSSPAGISCGSVCAHAFTQGTSVTLSERPASGSRFAGWSGGGCHGTGSCRLTLGTDVTVTASFSRVGPAQIRSLKLIKSKISAGRAFTLAVKLGAAGQLDVQVFLVSGRKHRKLVGLVVEHGKAGANKFTIKRVGKHTLKPGSYRLVVYTVAGKRISTKHTLKLTVR